ncbi:MAG: photosynthetic reaction center cytochrome c subunit [Polaromonas sp.]|nr:photosynthetic reaction center cytochrome c subunit [Polaromonas sp.]
MHTTIKLLLVSTGALILAACERPPIAVSQTGFRGTAMEQVYNPRTLATQASLNKAPAIADAIVEVPGGPKAGAIYQNVKVLGDLSVGEFARTMNAITEWVAPQQGCNYCHVAGNFADDSVYTKIVARKMLQMTQKINSGWKTHVAETGVTCYTCHRGNNIPTEIWFKPAQQKSAGGSLGNDFGQNRAAKSVGLSSLPYDPFTPYFLDAKPIRVNGKEALAMTGAAANRASTKQVEHTYGTMIHWSNSLGVNCTYCHNTQAFAEWGANATPQRATAWYGIRMAREINNEYMVPITNVFPASRLGPTGDVAKTNCATCHQGAYKPLYGAAMAKHYPAMYPSAKPGDAAAPAAPALPQAAMPAAEPVKPEVKAQTTGDSKPDGIAATQVSSSKVEALVK